MDEGDVTRVIQDFLTTNECELCLFKDDIVQIKSQIDRHWCEGYSNGKVGRAPLNYLITLEVPTLENDQKLFAAIADFPSQQAGDLSFNKGELIVGVKQVDENWWQGKIDETRVGIFPTTYAWELDTSTFKVPDKQISKMFKVQVKMDMTAQLEEEMDLHKGEILLVTEVIDKDWYRGVCGNRKGIFPSSYVNVLEESDATYTDGFDDMCIPELNIKESDAASSYLDISVTSSFVREDDKQNSSLHFNSNADDLSFLEDDYFKTNMPSMFQSKPSLQTSSSNYISNHKNISQEYQVPMELDIIPYGISLYPFYAQFDNELSFHEGEIVTLIRHVNKEWIEGKIDGRKGIFPSNYINIIVDCYTNVAYSADSGYGLPINGKETSNKLENDLVSDSFAVVLYNFDAQMNGDITVKDGEVVYIVKQINQDWCEVKNYAGNIGLCPRTYLASYSLPNKMNLPHQRYSLAVDSNLRDSEDNIICPSAHISEMNKRNYLPEDFLQPKTMLQKKGSLDDLISRNLSSLAFTSSWKIKKQSQRNNSAENLSVIHHKLDTINDEKERISEQEIPSKEYVSEEVNESQQKEKMESAQKQVIVNEELPQENPEYQLTAHTLLHPSRSAPPVPLPCSRSPSSSPTPPLPTKPIQRQMSDRMPHRPAPPVPLPGQQPVRRSIKLPCQKDGIRGEHSNVQNSHQMKNMITTRESQLKYVKHIRDETLVKMSEYDDSPSDVAGEDTYDDMKYKVRACNEKIVFLTAELERLKGSIDEDKDPKSEVQDIEYQTHPTDCEAAATGDESEEETRNKFQEQRQNVISELVFTEKEYVKDLKLTYETFNLHNPDFLGGRGIDAKVLFGNMNEVMLLAEDFLDRLYLSMKGKDEEDQCIGPCFLEFADRMKSVYGEYCMNHDNALLFLEKVEANEDIKKIFDKALETLRYQIVCFDMGSILIKPVQRILKYPLILNELIKCTEDTHKDKPELLKAVKTVMDVATYINEYKRRKDIVSKYLEDGNATISSRMSKLSLHSVAKKSTRLGALFTSTLGFGAVTKDSVFHDYEAVFHAIEKAMRTFLKNIEIFIQYMRAVVQFQWFIAENIAHFYQDKNAEIEEFVKIQKLIDKKFWKDFENTVHRRVSTPLNTLLELFDGPLILIQKRQDKFLDYNACFVKAEKNKDVRLVQDELLAARNNYEALNNHLLEELPTLLIVSSELFVECLLAFVTARKLLVGKVTKQYLALLEHSSKKTIAADPLEMFVMKHNLVLNQLSKFSFLSKDLKPDHGNRLSKNSPTFKERRPSTENVHEIKSNQSSSQRQYLQSRYSPNMIYNVVRSCSQNEPLDLSLLPGHLVAVIKKQNPMGDTNIWFVDDGASQGFVSSNNLEPFHLPQRDGSCGPESVSSTPLSNRSSVSSQWTNSDYMSRSNSSVSLPSFEEAVGTSHLYHYIEDSVDQKNIYEEIQDEEQKSPLYAEIPHHADEPVGEFYYALYNFDGNGIQTLTVKVGQVVRILQRHDLQNNTEWWLVEDRFGAKGFVPGNFLDRYKTQ